MNRSIWSRYGFAWVTAGFFGVSLVGHRLFDWLADVQEQQSPQQPVEVYGYLILMMRDALENWQSEFLQILWQVGGLAILLYVGSPQSKEGMTGSRPSSMPSCGRSIARRPTGCQRNRPRSRRPSHRPPLCTGAPENLMQSIPRP